MSRLTAHDALDLMFADPLDDLDSGGELDIEEDPDFPLPSATDSDDSDDSSQSEYEFDDVSSTGNKMHE